MRTNNTVSVRVRKFASVRPTPMPTRRIFIGSPIRRSGQNAAPPSFNASRPSSAGLRHVIRLSQRRSKAKTSSCRNRSKAVGGADGGGRHGRARERVGRRQQLQGHFITGFGDRTERKLVYGRARRVRECGARRPDQWAVGRWRPVPRQRARAVATEERLPADRRRRRRRPR